MLSYADKEILKMYTASPCIWKNRQDIHIDLFTIFNVYLLQK